MAANYTKIGNPAQEQQDALPGYHKVLYNCSKIGSELGTNIVVGPNDCGILGGGIRPRKSILQGS